MSKKKKDWWRLIWAIYGLVLFFYGFAHTPEEWKWLASMILGGYICHEEVKSYKK